MRSRLPAIACAAALGASLAVGLARAQVAAAPMAADTGCYNCHGEPARRNVPSFRQIVADYARYRGRPEAEKDLIDKLHHGGLFSHVAAHERLQEDEAARLVHWLVEGGQ